MTADGARTPILDLVKQLNAEIHARSGVFVGSRLLSVGHTGSRPVGTRALTPSDPITEVTTAGTGAVVSLLAKEERRFLAIVNRDYEAPMPLTVCWRDGVTMDSVGRGGTRCTVPGRCCNWPRS